MRTIIIFRTVTMLFFMFNFYTQHNAIGTDTDKSGSSPHSEGITHHHDVLIPGR